MYGKSSANTLMANHKPSISLTHGVINRHLTDNSDKANPMPLSKQTTMIFTTLGIECMIGFFHHFHDKTKGVFVAF